MAKANNTMDNRSRVLLKTLIEHYISDGQPVGSRALAKISGLELSPASVRNIMADLEEAGFVASPHTSAGRVPTARGYRLFVDSMLTVQPMNESELHSLTGALQGPAQAPQQLISSASQLLSDLTHFAGLVVLPQRGYVKIRQIEFLKLAERRVLLIVVTQEGEVQNRIVHTEIDYSHDDLAKASLYLNEHYAGSDLSQISEHLKREIETIQSDMKPLIESTLVASGEALHPSLQQAMVISGERNFLDIDDFANNMQRLRELFDLFEQRLSLLRLLDRSQNAEGVQIYIGSESGILSLDECSVVVAPYVVHGKMVGSLGVIGPTRMAYERVIPIVDITARLLSNALDKTAS